MQRLSAVDVSIFNLQGQWVRRLTSGLNGDGVHRVIRDGRDQNGLTACSGIYFVRNQNELL